MSHSLTHAITGGDPTLLFSFVAGLVSFLSPCVLPVMPAFLAHIAGTTLEADEIDRRRMFTAAALFVAGFGVVFAVLGVLINSLLAPVADLALVWLSRAAGLFIIVFGLHTAGLVRISVLEREHTLDLPTDLGSDHLTALLFGAAFAVGWTPCVGPILGSIFSLAAAQPVSAFTLLVAYAAGLGVPFLLIGLFPLRAVRTIRAHRGAARRVTVVLGYAMIVLGVLVFTMQLSRVASIGVLNEVLLG